MALPIPLSPFLVFHQVLPGAVFSLLLSTSRLRLHAGSSFVYPSLCWDLRLCLATTVVSLSYLFVGRIPRSPGIDCSTSRGCLSFFYLRKTPSSHSFLLTLLRSYQRLLLLLLIHALSFPLAPSVGRFFAMVLQHPLFPFSRSSSLSVHPFPSRAGRSSFYSSRTQSSFSLPLSQLTRVLLVPLLSVVSVLD